MKNKSSLLFLVISLIVLAFVSYILSIELKKNDSNLHLIFYNVGQGDSIFIKTPQNSYFLLDGGPSKEVLYKLSNDLPFYEREIDFVIVSHPHADHITGLIDVFKYYDISYLFYNRSDYQTSEIQSLSEVVSQNNNNVLSLYAGQILTIDDLKIDVLWPPENYNCPNDLNECSLILKLNYINFCAYLMGDAPTNIQDGILGKGECQILKIAHQGAENGLSPNFLEKVNPELGIISVGRNNFGHPSKETIDLLNKYKVKILRTDYSGDIKIISDGKKYYISEER